MYSTITTMLKTFEFILTEKCNRKCPFCYVSKTDFCSTITDIGIFYDSIKAKVSDGERYAINIFGGEPLTNQFILKKLIDRFRYENCELHLFTNGDMLTKDYYETYLYKVYLHITAYDIFTNRKKYEDILEYVDRNKVTFSFTFDQCSIDKTKLFIDTVKEMGVKHKVSFSHDIKSWDTIDINDLYDKIYSVYQYEMDILSVNAMNENYEMSKLLAPKLGRILERMYNYDDTDYFCFDSKEVFYNGKFIGGCIRYKDSTPDRTIPIRCTSCQYRYMCNKSCPAEYVCGDIPLKLCIIEKAGFESVMDYISTNKTKLGIKKFLKRQSK